MLTCVCFLLLLLFCFLVRIVLLLYLLIVRLFLLNFLKFHRAKNQIYIEMIYHCVFNTQPTSSMKKREREMEREKNAIKIYYKHFKYVSLVKFVELTSNSLFALNVLISKLMQTHAHIFIIICISWHNCKRNQNETDSNQSNCCWIEHDCSLIKGKNSSELVTAPLCTVAISSAWLTTVCVFTHEWMG